MEEGYCFLCQEPKKLVGHITDLCPNAKCRKCKQKGHTSKYCSDLTTKTDKKLKKLGQDSFKIPAQSAIAFQQKKDTANKSNNEVLSGSAITVLEYPSEAVQIKQIFASKYV